MPTALHLLANALPIPPIPTIPTTFPAGSWLSPNPALNLFSLRFFWAVPNCLRAPSMRKRAVSAVAPSTATGTLEAWIPAWVQAATSIWS